MAEELNEKDIAAICLSCTKEDCIGSDECYRERRKLYLRNYQADQRKAERATNRVCNSERSKAKRKQRKKALNSRRTVEPTGDEQVKR